jgi:hypothetical protein
MQEQNDQVFEFMATQDRANRQQQERRSLDLEERINTQERTNKIQRDRNSELEERLVEQEKINRQNQALNSEMNRMMQEFLKRPAIG